jgi:hypothetical protein
MGFDGVPCRPGGEHTSARGDRRRRVARRGHLLYYVPVLMVSRRWSRGYGLDPATGITAPSDVYGLRSLAITTVLWLVGSMTAGALLSLLGQACGRAPPPARRWPQASASG